jgi:hypothetical protein
MFSRTTLIAAAIGATALTACSSGDEGGSRGQVPSIPQNAPSTTSMSTSSAPGASESEGGQAEAEEKARERAKNFYAQNVHPGGKPGKDFLRINSGPGVARQAYCGWVDGKLPSFPVVGAKGNENGGMTGKWDVGITMEDRLSPGNDPEDCMKAMKFFADLFASSPDTQQPLTDLGGPLVDFQGNSHCSTTEDLGVPNIFCHVDRFSNTDTLVGGFVAYTRS